MPIIKSTTKGIDLLNYEGITIMSPVDTTADAQEPYEKRGQNNIVGSAMPISRYVEILKTSFIKS